jgi:GT2 family glycosyltransferase
LITNRPINKEAPRVHIVILNWNGWRDTIECLESVFRLDYPNFQVVLCDNDSQDGSLEKILAWSRGELLAVAADEPMSSFSSPAVPKPISVSAFTNAEVNQRSCYSEASLVILSTGGNLGFAGGNNVGLRYVLSQESKSHVWLLNNDTVIQPDTLSNMIRHSLQLNEKGIPNTCGSVQRYYYSPETIQCLGGFTFNRWTGICSATFGMGLSCNTQIDHDAFRARLHAIHGCSWLLPVSFLEDIGLMDEQYFLYYEEIDWAIRSRGKYQLTYAYDALVYHKEGGSIGSRSLNRRGSLLSEFYMNRNKFKVARKFFPTSLVSVFLFILLIAVRRAWRGEWDTARLLVKVAFGKQRF